MTWILLSATVLCGYITFATFRWWASLTEMPLHIFRDMWSDKLNGMPLSEQTGVRENIKRSPRGLIGIPIIFMFVTLVLAVATASEFLQ
jgi:hypothetical protein